MAAGHPLCCYFTLKRMLSDSDGNSDGNGDSTTTLQRTAQHAMAALVSPENAQPAETAALGELPAPQTDSAGVSATNPVSESSSGSGSSPRSSSRATSTNKIRPLATLIVTKNYYNSDNTGNTLQLVEDDIVYLLNKPNSQWWDGILIDPNGNFTRGWFPASHVKEVHRAHVRHDRGRRHRNENVEKEKNTQSKLTNLADNANNINLNVPSTPKASLSNSPSISHMFQQSSTQSPTSFTSNTSQHASRRPSVRPPRQKSLSVSHHPFIAKSKSSINLNNGIDSPAPSSRANSNLQHSNSAGSIFKEKNYFVTKHDSITSAHINNNNNAFHESRQSSQAFTENSSGLSNSICMVSSEEVNSYFKPANPQSQPSFNFVPMWIPQFDQNMNVSYKNQALNVYTNEIPFVNGDYVNEKSKFESPDTTNLFLDIQQLPISFHNLPSSDSSNIDTKGITANATAASHPQPPSLIPSQSLSSQSPLLLPNNKQNFQPKSSSIQDTLGGNRSYKAGPNNFQPVFKIPSYGNSRPTEIFYSDSTDILTYDTLVSTLINAVDQCINFLKKSDKLNYTKALNDASNAITMFHMLGRLTRQQLSDSQKFKKFSLILRKLTDAFIQFKIWSSLASFAIDKIEASKSVEKLNIKSHLGMVEITPETIKKYIQDSEIFRNRMEKIALHLGRLIQLLPIQNSQGLMQKNTSKLLPMLYPRFVRNNFESQHFKNTFVSSKSEQIDYFNDVNHSKANILLDDDAVDKLKETEKKINELLKSINEILLIKHNADTSLKTFMEEKNLKLLAAVYQCIPLLNTFLDTIESIDLTVFALIDKSAATTSLQDNNQVRNDTLISSDYSNRMKSSIGEHVSLNDFGVRSITTSDDGTELSDETDHDSQSFYDATAKTFRPMIQDFIHLKQSIHSIFTDLILDAQTITAEDSESFSAIRADKTHEKSGRTKMVADVMIKRLEYIDSQIFNDGIYTLEPSLKLIETIKFTKERIRLIILSTTQLKDERRVILNYCSRLMNTDFNVASLFIAERHNTLVSKMSQNFGKSISTVNSQANDGEQYDDGLVNSNELTQFYNENMSASNLSEAAGHNIPWYMTPDEDEVCLVYEATTLKGGPIKGLVSKLVNPLNPQDDLYSETFLCFFSTFMKPVKLFEILIEKYHLNMPEALCYEEYGIWLDQKLKPQQKRILDVFQKLFSKYWIVKYSTLELINLWESFVDETPSIDASLVALSNKVLSFENQQDYIDYFNLGVKEPKLIPMSLLNNRVLHMKLQNMNVLYAAQQITAVQAFYFRKLNLWDLIGRSYNFNRIFKKKNERTPAVRDPLGTKNISNFIKNCNNLTHYTTFMILKDSDVKTRVESIKYFITLAEKLLSLKNFSSMTAIISGLSSTSVSRLRKTWDEVPANYYKKFEKMDNLMSIGKNYSEYRNILKFVETDGDPYLPFLGMYLSDLRFTTDGNPDWLGNKKGSKGLVNFSKRVNIMKIIKEVLQFNDTLYKIKLDLEFSRYLHAMFQELPNDEKLYEMSINLEPRVSLFKDTTPFTSVAPGNSISSMHTVNLSNIFGTMNTFGSISTNRSSQSVDNALSEDTPSGGVGAESKHESVDTKKKGDHTAGKRPRKYRPLLSLTTSDKDKEKEKDVSKEM